MGQQFVPRKSSAEQVASDIRRETRKRYGSSDRNAKDTRGLEAPCAG
jgi:hypothetical protein